MKDVMKLFFVVMVMTLMALSALRMTEAKKIPLKHVKTCDMQTHAMEHVLDKPHRVQEKRRFLKQHPNTNKRRRTRKKQTDVDDDGVSFYHVGSKKKEVSTNNKENTGVQETAALYGSVIKTGYYAMELHLGTPSQTFQVIVDTGSTIGYVPCSFCGSKCGVHMNPPFDPQASTTANFVNCMSQTCMYFCGSRRCGCRSSLEFIADITLPMMSVCSYQRKYQEQSSSAGLLLTDKLRLEGLGDMGSTGEYEFGFGCETLETGAIYNQKADGVVGIGNNPSSLINQLVAQEAIENSFAICIGGFEGGGSMFLGREGMPTVPNMKYARLQKDRRNPEFYSVEILSMKLGSNTLNVPPEMYSEGYGTVIDTGTTFTYLPQQAYFGFNQLLEAEMAKHKDKMKKVPGPDPRYPNDLCYTTLRDYKASEQEVLDLFPSLTLDMTGEGGGAIQVELKPLHYLFKTLTSTSGTTHGFCVGVYNNGNAGTLLGSVMMRNQLVHFDLEKERVGFGDYECNSIE